MEQTQLTEANQKIKRYRSQSLQLLDKSLSVLRSGRWSQSEEAKKDPDYAPLKVFDIIGYAKTATSPIEAEP